MKDLHETARRLFPDGTPNAEVYRARWIKSVEILRASNNFLIEGAPAKFGHRTPEESHV